MDTATHSRSGTGPGTGGGQLWSRRTLVHSSCAAALLAPWARLANAAIYRDHALAAALFRCTPGEPIPEALWRAVARLYAAGAGLTEHRRAR